MTLNIIILIFAGGLLPFLLYYEYRENLRGLLPTKTALSALFVITALVQPHPMAAYTHFLLIGLLFCLGGDVFLALPQENMFRLGLVFFLIGHIFYVIAFFTTAHINMWTGWGTLIVLIFSIWIYLWLKPHLGTMSIPVLAYVVVITTMLSGAWSVLGDATVDGIGRIMIFSGASCFYISDVFVARDRFIKREAENRFIGLPLYYMGQFLLAFSVGLV
ncbi:MAG: lysoplasmalogenase [Deltaproteobacteria bacterium]|nr:lysoplasmalogenase [Deltaproteobacteria bacterium]